MARRIDARTITVSVVGLSGTEKEKGVTGIGKSCLCNRFMDPRADKYHTEHISVLSQIDFGGQVVNNDHYLYWGEVTKTSDEGVDHTFHVVEQTEFVDDSSFQPFKCGKTEPYYKRCAQIRLNSAEKLMYISETQLGLEHEFERVLMPDGKLAIDGFLCLFDVSLVPDRPIERQTEYTALILSNLLKTKKPIVLVTTKHDAAQEIYIREVEKILNRKEFRNINIPIVETSALDNVNVELAFVTLALLIDRTSGKTRLKGLPYVDAARTQQELKDVAKEEYLRLIRSHVTDHKAHWTSVLCKIKQNDNYIHFQDLCGTNKARTLFQRHVIQLKEQYLQRRQDKYLDQIALVLREVLPDLYTIADRSWPSTLQWLRRQDYFDNYFVIVPNGGSWRDGDFIDSNEQRIPYDLLEIREAEMVFRNHVNGLRAEQKRNELMIQFKRLLEKNQNLTGRSLAETAIFFLGHQCFSSLSEEDKNLIYEQHQEELKERARADFIELLQEHAVVFTKFEQNQVLEDDINEITAKLQSEPRWRALGRLEQDRRVILLNHLGFVQSPTRDKCPYREHCMENLIEAVLSTKAHRPQSWSRNSQFLLDAVDNRLSMVLLGSSGLADQLCREIKQQCIEDEYTLGGEIYCLDYRLIDGDVSLPQNSFKTADFKPHGCFCVYNSLRSLHFLTEQLRKTLMHDMHRGERMPFQGLPVVIILAHNPENNDTDLMQLRDEGQQLADRLQCPFIDTPSSLMLNNSRYFHQDQIALAMHNLVKCIQHRSSFVNPWQMAESIEPDIRILMCFMCGDAFQVDLPLAPLLNHQCCYVTPDKCPTITLETYLDDSKRKVEVSVTSYHGGTRVREDLYHGFILVYSAKRKASLANLGAFACNIPPVPTKIIAVSEVGAANAFFSSESEQNLIVEGNALADKLHTSFMVTCANFRQHTESYTPFFKECWDKKNTTEHMFEFSLEDSGSHLVDARSYESVRHRQPTMLPKDPKRNDAFGVGKSSTSNSQSTEDSEPIYDHPHLTRCQTDSDPEDHRASSTSPPPRLSPLPPGLTPPPPGQTPPLPDSREDSLYSVVSEENYGELASSDTEHLLKPSQLKNKRAMYADKYRKSFPSATKSLASMTYRERDDSTDTDNSMRSPRVPRRECYLFTEFHPQTTFRKSTSMRMALPGTDEGLGFLQPLLQPIMAPRPPVVDRPRLKRLLKSSTLPGSVSLSAQASEDSSTVWENNHTADGKTPPPTLPKPKGPSPKPSIGTLDFKKYGEVREMINKNLTASSKHGSQTHKSKAPLATPEHIDVIGEYAQVKDALPMPENTYASVADALPSGHIHRIRSTFRSNKKKHKGTGGTDSDSEGSSHEGEKRSEDIYSRVNRRPTPHKKRNKPRNVDGTKPPALPPYTDDRQVLVQDDHLQRGRPSASEGSDGTADELMITSRTKLKKKKSFRSKKDKAYADHQQDLVGPPQPWSDSNLTDSPLSKASVEDDGPYELNTSGEFKGRFVNKSKDQQRLDEKRAKEDKRRRKEEEKRQKEVQKIRKKLVKGRPGLMSQNSSTWGTIEEQRQSETEIIPLFVMKCVQFIEEEGLRVEGLYRVPGNKAQVDMLLDKFSEDPSLDIKALDIPVNAVATALKQFFSELITEPLIPNYVYDDLVTAAGVADQGDRLAALDGVISRIPITNWEVLKYLVTHMAKVADNYKENSMTSQNLSICWWPTVLRPDMTSLDHMAAMSGHLSDIIQTLIDSYLYFFYRQRSS